MAREPRNIADLLSDPRTALGRLVANAEKRKSLIMQVKSCLDPAMSQHLIGVNMDGDTLILLCDSASWASRLRYAESELRGKLADRYDQPVKRIRVKVRAPDQG